MAVESQQPESEQTTASKDANNAVTNSVMKNALSLGLYAVLTVGLVAGTWVYTSPTIAEQVRAYEAKALMEILPPSTHDNQLIDSRMTLEPSPLLGSQDVKQAYVATRNGSVIAVIIPVTAPDGYSGCIELLMGIYRDGSIAGVRAVNHKETPGLGDKINTNVTDWIISFDGKSLESPTADSWAVKKDGGEFDQFAGATITPRAVVNAVYRALQYFEVNRNRLLDTTLIQLTER